MARRFMTRALVERMARARPEERRRLIAGMTPGDVLDFDTSWETWAHDQQLPPNGDGWRTWLMMAGRGFGKTRAGAEWITELATQRGRPVSIALVGATLGEARQVMIEGESGLLGVAEARRLRGVTWEPSRGLVRWAGGSEAYVYSAETPDGLRGPGHDFAWCDELAKWSHAEETWNNLQFTLRNGDRPRALVTTTPRPIPLIKTIMGLPTTVTTGGRTRDNTHLSPHVIELLTATYGGTRLGRQELDGELIEEAEGALWTRELIERCRAYPPRAERGEGDHPAQPDGGGAGRGAGDPSTTRFASGPPPRASSGRIVRVVVGVDPPAGSRGDACGIVVAGLGADGRGYVLADASVEGRSPEGWARAVANAAGIWGADRVIAEANNGGEMVESVLRGADIAMPVRRVHAARGKSARAEPVAALYEAGRVAHRGAFPALEDELCGLIAGGGYEGPGSSPDRADALVWALTELMLGKRGGGPRVRGL